MARLGLKNYQTPSFAIPVMKADQRPLNQLSKFAQWLHSVYDWKTDSKDEQEQTPAETDTKAEPEESGTPDTFDAEYVEHDLERRGKNDAVEEMNKALTGLDRSGTATGRGEDMSGKNAAEALAQFNPNAHEAEGAYQQALAEADEAARQRALESEDIMNRGNLLIREVNAENSNPETSEYQEFLKMNPHAEDWDMNAFEHSKGVEPRGTDKTESLDWNTPWGNFNGYRGH